MVDVGDDFDGRLVKEYLGESASRLEITRRLRLPEPRSQLQEEEKNGKLEHHLEQDLQPARLFPSLSI
jgi:hypothetical protein